MPEPYQPGELVQLREEFRHTTRYPERMRTNPFHIREVRFPDPGYVQSQADILRDGQMIVTSQEDDGWTVWIHRIERVEE